MPRTRDRELRAAGTPPPRAVDHRRFTPLGATEERVSLVGPRDSDREAPPSHSCTSPRAEREQAPGRRGQGVGLPRAVLGRGHGACRTGSGFAATEVFEHGRPTPWPRRRRRNERSDAPSLQRAIPAAVRRCVVHATDGRIPRATRRRPREPPPAAPGITSAIPPVARQELLMTDIIYIATTVGFFAVAWLYARGCERL